MKYIIESGDDRAERSTLKEAKLVAAEWQLERERRVTIECDCKPGQKFLATLRPNDKDELDISFEALWHPAGPKQEVAGEITYAMDVEYRDAELERARRVAIYSAQLNRKTKRSGGGKRKRPVIRIAPFKRFESVLEAATFAGIDPKAFRRKLNDPDGNWKYAEVA